MPTKELVVEMDGCLAVAADTEVKHMACRSAKDYAQAGVYYRMCEKHTVLAFKIDTELSLRKQRQSLNS